jgi:putative aldouronate transport system permease protein
MSLPGLVYLVVYKFLPLIGLSLAFKDYDMFAGTGLLDSMLKSEWVGLGYFRRIFSSPQFWSLLRNTLLISVYKIVILFPLPILLAFLMNELRSVWFKRTVQTLLYLPHFLSWVIIYGIFFTLLSTDGIVNQALARLGLSPVMFFTDQSLFRPLLVVTEGWREAGWGTIVYLAALTSIDPALYEAALMDGANRWQRMVHITFPSILPVVALMLLLRVGNILQAGFEQILVMYNPAVYPVADILQTYIYRIGLGKLDFSTGTAMGMFESVVGFVLVITCNGISRKFFERSLW